MNEKLSSYFVKPEIYKESTAKFWDDEHISKGMLKAHLDPEFEGATRRHSFVDKSVEWIAEFAPPDKYPKLLDLGCGPGLYAERFYHKGYQVTGVDFSARSIDYARKSAEKNAIPIEYRFQNYLDISEIETFDLVTLIYCDFCVLSDTNREILLKKIYQALKPNGKFIVDVTTPNQYENRNETKDWYFNEGDFWCEKPHLCLYAFYRYDESNTMLNQTVVITEETVKSYYLWDHTFTSRELEREISECGFNRIELFGDVTGAKLKPESNVICAVVTKDCHEKISNPQNQRITIKIK